MGNVGIGKMLAGVREGTAGPWVDAVLLAARHLGVAVSPELVRNSSAWAGRPDSGQAIIDIALSAGLSGTFVEIPLHELSPDHAPCPGCSQRYAYRRHHQNRRRQSDPFDLDRWPGG